jgi:hypothetical protein
MDAHGALEAPPGGLEVHPGALEANPGDLEVHPGASEANPVNREAQPGTCGQSTGISSLRGYILQVVSMATGVASLAPG